MVNEQCGSRKILMPHGGEEHYTGQISLYKTQITLTSLLARKQKPIDNL